MYKLYNLLIKMFVFGFLFIGITMICNIACSKSGIAPVAPAENEYDGVLFSDFEEGTVLKNREIIGVWSIEFDPDSMDLNILPGRFSTYHFNISGFVLPPGCLDCLTYSINGWDPVNQILDVNLKLSNPTSLVVYDVRGILYSTNLNPAPLVNADAWTPLYDIAGGDSHGINPFKAFAKDVNRRIFGGYVSHTVSFQIDFSSYTPLYLAFDASIGGNCEEPYSIDNFIQHDPMYESGDITSGISVDVYHWDNDVDSVLIQSPYLWSGWESLIYDYGNKWVGTIRNEYYAPDGTYKALIKATSSKVAYPALYDYVDVEVGDDQIYEWFAYSSDRSGNYEIYLRSLDGTYEENLTNHNACDYALDFSPDGSILYFNSDRNPNGKFDVYALNMETRVITNITNDSTNHQYGGSVSPCGNWIVTVDDTYGKDIVQLRSDGSMAKHEWLRLATTGAYEHEPSWSPDGSTICYYKIDGVGNDIWLMDSFTGSNQRRLHNEYGDDHGPKYSCDGGKIVYWGNRTNPAGVFSWSFDTNSSHVYYVHPSERTVICGFSPDCNYVLLTIGNPGNIYYASFPEMQPGEPILLVSSSGHDSWAVWRP